MRGGNGFMGFVFLFSEASKRDTISRFSSQQGEEDYLSTLGISSCIIPSKVRGKSMRGFLLTSKSS